MQQFFGRYVLNIVYKFESNGFLTRSDFNKQVLIDFLSGATRTEIELKYKNISISTVSRILDAEFRERLKINDLG